MNKKIQLAIRVGISVLLIVIVVVGVVWIYQQFKINHNPPNTVLTKITDVQSDYPAPSLARTGQSFTGQDVYPPASQARGIPTDTTPAQKSSATPTAIKSFSIQDVQRTSLEDAKTAFDNKEAIFVDVRSSQSYAGSHISGAVSIPEDQIFDNLNKLDPNRWIITYCS